MLMLGYVAVAKLTIGSFKGKPADHCINIISTLGKRFDRYELTRACWWRSPVLLEMAKRVSVPPKNFALMLNLIGLKGGCLGQKEKPNISTVSGEAESTLLFVVLLS
ncbi:hypothetical protein JOB18_011438 [Solea senegalensis]|uniref:Uncharacterized protein n=1 Tax=Solea senegalensis TaxID=28829 RepID=A0AAV6RNL8_SOLSE|nr:hypothetical protein JOB18_011438 [Solea senegalensis]